MDSQSSQNWFFCAGPDGNKPKEFAVGNKQTIIKEQQVACITGTSHKNVRSHAKLMAAMANKCTSTKSAIQQYPTRTLPVPTFTKIFLQPQAL